jgi:DNA-binding transcriptional LysR family regulator
MKTVHIPDIDLRGMKLIVELSELCKLTAAAHRLGVSQSAASHALTRLRERLGDQLFVRTASGFQPTSYGERLAVASREVLNTLAAGLSTDRSIRRVPHVALPTTPTMSGRWYRCRAWWRS